MPRVDPSAVLTDEGLMAKCCGESRRIERNRAVLPCRALGLTVNRLTGAMFGKFPRGHEEAATHSTGPRRVPHVMERCDRAGLFSTGYARRSLPV